MRWQAADFLPSIILILCTCIEEEMWHVVVGWRAAAMMIARAENHDIPLIKDHYIRYQWTGTSII